MCIPRLIDIVCERTLLIGYVEEEQVLKAPHVDQAVADLNLKPIGDGIEQHTGALGIESTLLLRMAGQLDTIMKRACRAGGGAGGEPRPETWIGRRAQDPAVAEIATAKSSERATTGRAAE